MITGFEELLRTKIFKDADGMNCCTDCDFKSQITTNVRNHVEAHHVGPGRINYTCNYCGNFPLERLSNPRILFKAINQGQRENVVFISTVSIPEKIIVL